MLHKLKNRSIQTFLLITIYAILAPHLSNDTHRLLYTISIIIKDTLILLMPITVGVFIASTIDSFERKAPIFVLMLILFEASSNFVSVCYAYIAGYIMSFAMPEFASATLNEGFSVLWRIPITKPFWWGADKGCVVGLVIGSISAFMGVYSVKRGLYRAKNFIETMLIQGFSKLIPIYVVGCIAQIYKTGLLSHMVLHYGMLIIYLIIVMLIYVCLIFAVGNWFRLSEAMRNINNLLPAGLMALTSGCSLSTMPWTIKAVSGNLRDPELAKVIIPATTNVQMVGDCIANAFLCFLIYKSFFGYNPDIMTWSIFTAVFVATRFATVGVQGGATFLMLPIYQHYLSFNDEMLAIILALNVVLDNVITSINVMGNGGLAKVFENVWGRIGVRKS